MQNLLPFLCFVSFDWTVIFYQIIVGLEFFSLGFFQSRIFSLGVLVGLGFYQVE